MTEMRRSTLRLYGPFIAVVLAQALFVVALPSTAPDRATLNVGAGGSTPQGGNSQKPGGAGSTASSAGAGSSGAGASSSGAVGSKNGDATNAADGATGSAGGTGPAPGDASHCAGPYQFDVLLGHGPPCQPVFAGDNGGATHLGVTADSVKVVYFSPMQNEQANQILGVKGLAVTSDQQDAAIAAYQDFINAHYELYGRKLVIKHVTTNCPASPPDYDKCTAAAQKVVDEEHPFAVIWPTPTYADVFSTWANAGVISIGGFGFDRSYYTDFRPFRYDLQMDGTQSADFIAEYYCKKLVGKPPDHAGAVIHPSIGSRNTPGLVRRLAVVSPEIRANTLTSQRLIDEVKACGGDVVDRPFTYSSDITTATTQTESTIASLIQNRVTTIVCMCDVVAPIFFTKGLTSQQYFPEHVLPGMGLLDYDIAAQLYDQQQWTHAFGPSQLGIPTGLDDSDPGRVWRAQGNSGHPCGNNGCQLEWGYLQLAAEGIQQAGPTLNPLTFEQGLLYNTAPVGGAGHVPLYRWGPDDYTGVDDIKEVYWNPTATSAVDGSTGAYIAVGGDTRYQRGQLSAGLDPSIPVNP
jgi:hypothetical protein